MLEKNKHGWGFNFCPNCGSENLNKVFEFLGTETRPIRFCNKCQLGFGIVPWVIAQEELERVKDEKCNRYSRSFRANAARSMEKGLHRLDT